MSYSAERPVPPHRPGGGHIRIRVSLAEAKRILQAHINRRYYPGRAEALINRTIDENNLAGTGYDPSWLERRRAERARLQLREVPRG